MNNSLSKTEARAVITALFTICYFTTIVIIAIYAPAFFEKVFTSLTVLYASAIMNFYGARNGEKRIDQLLQQLPMALAGRVTDELKPLIEMLRETIAKSKGKPL